MCCCSRACILASRVCTRAAFFTGSFLLYLITLFVSSMISQLMLSSSFSRLQRRTFGKTELSVGLSVKSTTCTFWVADDIGGMPGTGWLAKCRGSILSK